MKSRHLRLLIAVVVSLHFSISAATTHYVNASNPAPAAPYTSWTTAATNIQDALNIAGSGDTVFVTNGVYQYGGSFINGSNRVALPFGVSLQSVNGPSVTIIKGCQVPGTTNGAGAARCVYLNQFSTLSGFTLTNGATQTSFPNNTGGGIYVNSGDCVISNCIITGNSAYANGGGIFGYLFSPPVINCIVSGNTAGNGGGAYVAVLVNCTISNNNAINGGGLYNCAATNCLLTANGNTNNTSGGAADNCALNNCTVVGNFENGLGAMENCTANNCIIYYNTALSGLWSDCYSSRLTNCCALDIETVGSPVNCITNAPGFVNFSGGDFHLNPWSRCVNAGTNVVVTLGADLDGNPRIVGAAVDIGCYENQSPLTNGVHYVSLLNANPVAPYTNWLKAATNIQDAVAVALPGETVIVDDGVYTNGGTVIYGAETNRVALTNGITLASAGGTQAATIVGGTKMRCVYVGSNSVLMGFTLTNGHASNTGDLTNEQCGGGAWCETGGVISNCWIVRNFTQTSSGMGAGVFGGAAYNCVVTNNGSMVNGLGTGAAYASLYNCLVVSNSNFWPAYYGGGLYHGAASNCTFTGNNAYLNGGGAAYSKLLNCTLAGNVSSLGVAGAYQSMLSNCIVTGNQGSYGGAYQSTNYNCTFVGNSGRNSGGGGGVNGGVSYNCIFTNNSCANGGGATGATLYNCLLVGNFASNGGGVFDCTLNNCTVVGNVATNFAGGVYGSVGSVNNSIVYYNLQMDDSIAFAPNYSTAKFNFSCSFPSASGLVTTNPPLFVDTNSDFHLLSNSPCINSGKNSFATNPDMDGNSRIVGGTVDIGAYEFQSPSSVVSYAFLQQYGFPTDGSADYLDSDGDGLNNYAEWKSGTDPTNSSSVLAVQTPAATPTNATITWQSVSGYFYYVQRTADLTQPFQTIATNILGQVGTTSYTDNTATNGVPNFYRVGVQ